jgi:hypothetical protein
MNLTQLKWVKSELKRRFYDQNKFSGKTVNNIIFHLAPGGAPVSHGGTSPERSKIRWELDETTMDSRMNLVWWLTSGRDGFAGKARRRVRGNASCR